MKKILVLGSSGSIGQSTLDIVKTFPEMYGIAGLSVNSNIDILEKQIGEFAPPAVVVRDQKKAAELRNRIGSKCEILSGEEGLLEIAGRDDYDILLSALVGFAGLAPTLEAIKKRKRIALANKETLVVAGEIVMRMAEEYNSEILPVDSEHSAIFQCLAGESKHNISKLILTASGGPFFLKDKSEFDSISVEQALNHPNWKMGNKITIDSATMMNKGLEVIEAHWLFNLPKEKIEVIIHPQSIIHSMVEYIDGSIKAQLSLPDMKLPILYALSYPERLQYGRISTDLRKIKELTFFEPDFNKFVCLKLAFEVMEAGGTAPCILNAANEVAVGKFLNKEIGFTQIPDLISDALNYIKNDGARDLQSIVACDADTRSYLKRKYN